MILVSGRLLGGTRACLEQDLECAMENLDRFREERLSRRRELYRPCMAKETSKEREARLLRQCDQYLTQFQ